MSPPVATTHSQRPKVGDLRSWRRTRDASSSGDGTILGSGPPTATQKELEEARLVVDACYQHLNAPAGKELPFSCQKTRQRADGRTIRFKVHQASGGDCVGCVLQARCTTAPEKGRTVRRDSHQEDRCTESTDDLCHRLCVQRRATALVVIDDRHAQRGSAGNDMPRGNIGHASPLYSSMRILDAFYPMGVEKNFRERSNVSAFLRVLCGARHNLTVLSAIISQSCPHSKMPRWCRRERRRAPKPGRDGL